MKNRVLILLLCLIGSVTLSAQPVVNEFIRIGDKLLPSLTVEQRKDLVDFFLADKKANTKSLLGDAVQITQMTDSTLTVQLSESGRMQIVMLPTDSTYIDLLIFSSEGKMPQSRLSFYNRKGETIEKNKLFPTLTIRDFVQSDTSKETVDQILKEVGVYFIELSFDPETRLLGASLSIEPNQEEGTPHPSLALIRKNPLTFRWDGVRFSAEAAK